MRHNHNTMLARKAIKETLTNLNPEDHIGVGCSGGADSLALLAALSTIYHGERAHQVHVIIIDHQLQTVTAQIAETTAQTAKNYGFTTHITPITITKTSEGMEADARTARYEAFENAINTHNLQKFLIGHTKNDQAEQLMLGLLRGSGTRSLSGIPETRDKYARPLLNHLTRKQTEQVCHENGLTYWNDPHNTSDEYTRVRIRKFLNNAETATNQTLIEPLARTAQMLAEDADTLDYYANIEYDKAQQTGWHITTLQNMPKPIRTRILRRHIIEHGCPPDQTTHHNINQIDQLITNWHGQKPITLANGIHVHRDTKTR